MELWIRNQDKTALTSVDNICAIENRIVFIPNRVNGRATLGKYKTEKRALEVLDEIQNLLQPKVFIKESKINTDDLINSMSEYVALKTTQQVEYDLKHVLKKGSSYLFSLKKVSIFEWWKGGFNKNDE